MLRAGLLRTLRCAYSNAGYHSTRSSIRLMRSGMPSCRIQGMSTRSVLSGPSVWRSGSYRAASGLGIATAFSAAAMYAVADSGEEKSRKEEWEDFKAKKMVDYENRIRAFSGPEKVFYTFASVWKEGEQYMTPGDFVRSLNPYPLPAHLESEQEAEGGGIDSEFFKKVDLDGDGLISFPEYTFFLTLLSIPEKDFHVAFTMFDLDGNGILDKTEFARVIKVMRKRFPQGQQQATRREEVSGDGVMSSFFGVKGDQKLTFKAFSAFLHELQHEVNRLEFQRFDKHKKGKISLYDFAWFLVAHVDHHDLPSYEARVEKLKGMPGDVTVDEFLAFSEMLKHLDEMSVAVDTYSDATGGFSKSDFMRAAHAVAGVDLNPLSVAVLFEIFDKDGDGHLNADECVGVLRQRVERGMSRERNTGFIRFINCYWNCVSCKE